MKDGEDLDEISKRLLSGIIQAPPRARKRFDKLTKEEIWERRRQTARDKGNSDYDDEVDNDSFNMDTIENNKMGSDSLDPGVVAQSMKRKKISKNKVTIAD